MITRESLRNEDGSGMAEGATDPRPNPRCSEHLAHRLGFVLAGIAGEEIGSKKLDYAMVPFPHEQREWFEAAWFLAEADGVTAAEIASDESMQLDYVAQVHRVYQEILETIRNDPLLDVLVAALMERPTMNADDVVSVVRSLHT
ncbi:MAG: hypothetical protein EOP84_24085 [Verrucomicrobiaceae bacterium]|nr:MAG: hypothetical protein EOP84_24085 [Verrucomicrobiaceae bacterium]